MTASDGEGDALRQAVAGVTAALARAHAEAAANEAALRARLDQAASSQAQQAREAAALRAQCLTLKGKTEAAEMEALRLTAELRRQAKALRQQDAALQRVTAERDAMRRSLSWRVTHVLHPKARLQQAHAEAAPSATEQAAVRQLLDSGLLDAEWYGERYPDATGDAAALALHYLRSGAAQGYDPNPLFATAWYAARVADAGPNPLLHYIERGEAQDLPPHPLFDVAWYRAHNPDVAGGLLAHFLGGGCAAGRSPNAEFDPVWYFQTYADVAGKYDCALVHYALHGQAEGRQTRAPPEAHAGPSAADDRLAVAASGLFDAAWYRRTYADAVADVTDLLGDYLGAGCAEGRDPNPLFDSRRYLAGNLALAVRGGNPLLHFVRQGAAEGRAPHPNFSTTWYVATNPELRASGENPLAHYLRQGRQQGRAAFSEAADYAQSLGRLQRAAAAQRDEWQRHIATMTYRPRFVVLHAGAGGAARAATLRALDAQFYPAALAVAGLTHAEAGIDPDATYLLVLEDGDELDETALYACAAALNADPSHDLVYFDEDLLAPDGRSDPVFKPDWSPDTLEAVNYLAGACCIRLAVLRGLIDDSPGGYDLVLRVTERTQRIHHIREVLVHRQRTALCPAGPEQVSANLAALQARLRRTGRSASVTQAAAGAPAYRVLARPVSPPLVSLLPLVADWTDERVAAWLQAVRAKCDYPAVEMLPPMRRETLAQQVNAGAAAATGTLLLLLREGCLPQAMDWLAQLVGEFEKPHVGVAGGSLVGADGTEQQLGLVLHAGLPAAVQHVLRRRPLGYAFSGCTSRNVVGVTEGCMMTRIHAFREHGGFAEASGVLAAADYCLRLWERGATTVMVPAAAMVRPPGALDPAAPGVAAAAYFQARWAGLPFDPYYNTQELTVSPASLEVHHNDRLL